MADRTYKTTPAKRQRTADDKFRRRERAREAYLRTRAAQEKQRPGYQSARAASQAAKAARQTRTSTGSAALPRAETAAGATQAMEQRLAQFVQLGCDRLVQIVEGCASFCGIDKSLVVPAMEHALQLAVSRQQGQQPAVAATPAGIQHAQRPTVPAMPMPLELQAPMLMRLPTPMPVWQPPPMQPPMQPLPVLMP